MTINFISDSSLQRLQYVSQFSNAVLVCGLDHGYDEAFDYATNTLSIQCKTSDRTPSELKKWRNSQFFHPSFELSTAVVFYSPTSK